MGRGRAKAKQTKVARRLKYYSPDTDLTALERELKAAEGDGVPSPAVSTSDDGHDTAGSDGRNGSAGEEADHWSGDDDVAEGSGTPSSNHQARPAPAPGSWMKKRA
ncbi:MAG: DUF3073 domain-containing protein [Ornithinimicrobium sp.]